MVALGATLLFVSACATPSVPRAQNDVCAIFDQHPSWRKAAERTEQRWGTPVALQMAIIWKESSFRHDARPPKKRVFFGLVPWGRISSAYGYSQALDGTWDWYLEDTGRNRLFASRTDFSDASDFVGWYTSKTKRTNGVSMGDAVSQYLAYHEGHGGYRRGTFKSKPWLLRAARRVGQMSHRYAQQLDRC